jgi:hypothetical protein
MLLVECLVECLVVWAAWEEWVEWVCKTHSALNRIQKGEFLLAFFFICTKK